MSAAARSEVRLPAWLALNRNFVLLWLAYGIAAFGDHLSEMALLKTRGGLTRPDVTRLQALMTFAFFIPFVVLGPLAGWCSDRFSRRATMIIADVLRAVLVFNMAWIVAQLADALPAAIADLSIVIPLVVVGALAAFFSPARQALLPTLIQPDQLVRANAMINALGTIGAILSAILGGVLVDMHMEKENFHINAATFAISAVCVWGISMRRSRAAPHPPLEGVWTPLRDGFRYVFSHRRVLQLVLMASVYWAAAGVAVSVVPAVGKVYFGENYAAAASLRGVLAAGLAAGAAVMTIIGPTIPLQVAYLVGFIAAGSWLLLLAISVWLQWSIVVTGVSLFGVGGAGASILVTIMATLQRFVPDSRRGRVFGVSDTSTMAAMVLTSGLLGLPNIPDLDRYVPILLLLTGGGLLITALVAWRAYRRHDEITDTAAAWWVWRLVRFYATFWCRARRDGVCTAPRRGPVIIAANHTSGVDALALLATCTSRVISFWVEQKYYRHPLVGPFMRINHCVPIDRENPGKSSFTGALRLLRDGGCLGVFPQGDFAAPDAPPIEAKAGVGLIALRSGAVVIPVHISGATYTHSPLAGLFSRHHVTVRYGRPVDLGDLAARNDDRGAAEAAAARIMDAIDALRPKAT